MPVTANTMVVVACLVVVLLPLPWLMLHFLRLRKEPFHIYSPGG